MIKKLWKCKIKSQDTVIVCLFVTSILFFQSIFPPKDITLFYNVMNFGILPFLGIFAILSMLFEIILSFYDLVKRKYFSYIFNKKYSDCKILFGSRCLVFGDAYFEIFLKTKNELHDISLTRMGSKELRFISNKYAISFEDLKNAVYASKSVIPVEFLFGFKEEQNISHDSLIKKFSTLYPQLTFEYKSINFLAEKAVIISNGTDSVILQNILDLMNDKSRKIAFEFRIKEEHVYQLVTSLFEKKIKY